jgi:hypothetical protein
VRRALYSRPLENFRGRKLWEKSYACYSFVGAYQRGKRNARRRVIVLDLGPSGLSRIAQNAGEPVFAPKAGGATGHGPGFQP